MSVWQGGDTACWKKMSGAAWHEPWPGLVDGDSATRESDPWGGGTRTLAGSAVILHYTTLHYTTLHYTIYTRLHYTINSLVCHKPHQGLIWLPVTTTSLETRSNRVKPDVRTGPIKRLIGTTMVPAEV